MAQSERSIVWRRALLVWLGIVGAEVVHGACRVLFLQPILGDFRARQVAVLTGSILIFSIVLLTVGWVGNDTAADAPRIGVAWLGLMVVFELAAGRMAGLS